MEGFERFQMLPLSICYTYMSRVLYDKVMEDHLVDYFKAIISSKERELLEEGKIILSYAKEEDDTSEEDGTMHSWVHGTG